ncbi:hypothetical protein FQN52_002548 [Onygenales sp. PD_12]|nr:hypothetical protein FQN52_002548 [Onygenales sp. PD_12]
MPNQNPIRSTYGTLASDTGKKEPSNNAAFMAGYLSLQNTRDFYAAIDETDVKDVLLEYTKFRYDGETGRMHGIKDDTVHQYFRQATNCLEHY